jgi:phage gpG-like protein
MIDLTARVTGAEAVVAQLGRAGVNFSQRVPMTVRALGIELQRRVREAYLVGPRPEKLGRKTGRLSRSINEKASQPDQWTYKSTVGTNVSYASIWELGFDRKVGAGARGGPRTILNERARAKYFQKHPAGMKHYNARPFLVPALADMKDDIRARLVAAITGGR